MITDELRLNPAHIQFPQNFFKLVNFGLDGGEGLFLFSKYLLWKSVPKSTHLIQVFN